MMAEMAVSSLRQTSAPSRVGTTQVHEEKVVGTQYFNYTKSTEVDVKSPGTALNLLAFLASLVFFQISLFTYI